MKNSLSTFSPKKKESQKIRIPPPTFEDQQNIINGDNSSNGPRVYDKGFRDTQKPFNRLQDLANLSALNVKQENFDESRKDGSPSGGTSSRA